MQENKTKKQLRAEKKENKKARRAEKKEGRKKLSSADKKGILLIVLLIVVALALFSGIKNAISASEPQESSVSDTTLSQTAPPLQTAPATPPAPQTQPAAASTAAPTSATAAATALPTTTAPSVSATDTTAPTEPLTTESAEPDKAEILDTITKAINSLQSDTASFRGTKAQVIYIQLNDCSVPFLTGTINKVLEHFAGEEITEYDFTDGKAYDSEEEGEISSLHAIPPTDKPFSLTAEGVATASTEKSAEGTTYTVTLVSEDSTLANPRPPHHNAAGDTLDFSAFELPLGEITKADFHYPGATVSVTLDEKGKIIRYHEKTPMKGTGEGNAIGISASGEMEGYIDEVWTIEWK